MSFVAPKRKRFCPWSHLLASPVGCQYSPTEMNILQKNRLLSFGVIAFVPHQYVPASALVRSLIVKVMLCFALKSLLENLLLAVLGLVSSAHVDGSSPLQKNFRIGVPSGY